MRESDTGQLRFRPASRNTVSSEFPYTSVQSFRREHGEPSAPDGYVFAAPVPAGLDRAPGSSSERFLVATVEPVDKTEYGWSVAAQALEALRQGFAAQYASTVPEALARGFAAANACVRAANRGEMGRRRGERVFVGAAAMALDGQQLILAHVPPVQIVFSQDQMVYSIPAIQSWEPHFAGSGRSRAEPFGARDQIEPDMFQTAVDRRDTVVLCSTSLGRAIAGLPALEETLRPPLDPAGRPLVSLPIGPAEHPITLLDMGPVRPAGPDPALAWIDWLDHVAIERRVPSCHAVAATVGQVEGRASQGSAGRSRPRERVASRAPEPEPAPVGSGRVSTPAGGWSTSDRLDRSGQPRIMHVPVGPVDPPRNRGQLQMPGANGVRRFAGNDGILPEGWRASAPRIILRREIDLPRWFAVALAILVLLSAGTGVGYLRSSAVETDLADALGRIDEQLASADASDDASELGILRGQLQTLTTRYGASTAVDQRLVRLVSVEDRLLGRLRLSSPVELGQLPGESIPADRSVRLLHAGNGVFVVGNSLYELDGDGSRLVHLLGAGDTVDGQITGPIVDAVATRSGIAVTDGVALFDRDSRGRWAAEPFDARLELSPGQVAAIALYDDQMVAIDGSSGSVVAIPLAGTATGGAPALPPSLLGASAGALDLAVNDDLFVLGAAGNLTSYDRLGQSAMLTVPVAPPLRTPRAMDTDGPNLWIFDVGNGPGRLVCYSPATDRAVVYELPVAGIEAVSPLTMASDFAIDPAGNRIVFLSGTTLWSVPLPIVG